MFTKLLRLLFYWPFRLFTNCNPIPFEPEKNIHIDRNNPICYLTVSSSLGNLMCLERLTQRMNLPSPFKPLIINNMEIPRVGVLHHPRMFSSKARDADICSTCEEWFSVQGVHLQVLTVTVLWTRNPGYEGQEIHGLSINHHTSSFRKFINLIFAGRDNCTLVSPAVDTFIFREKLGANYKREVLLHLIMQHFIKKVRSVIGKPFPNRQKLIEDILERPAIAAAIEAESQKTKKTPDELRKKARNILEVMASDPRYPLLKFFNTIISNVWKKIYHGQIIIGAEKVRREVQSGHEIIYIPCHRSHMDYVLLSFVIFHEGLPLPQIASGENLNFFPVGPIIKRCGAYFIRRKMKGDNFYIAIFNEYLSMLFERGYATEFFIEGGRSRTGRTLPPKTGMVAMAVGAQLRGIERPIVFIPTYLGYEHVSEVHSYMNELKGRHKQKESAMKLLGIFKRMRYYGRGYVTFGDPIEIPHFLNEHVPDWKKDIDPFGTRHPEWLRSTVNSLADTIIMGLNDAAMANGINLCAMAIMSDTDHTLSMNKLRACLNMYIQLLKIDAKRAKHLTCDDVETLIKQALELNKFHRYDVGDDMQFVRPSYGQSLQLTYFKNNIVHLFALPALIANIIIRNGRITREQITSHTRSLFYFLRHELFAPVTENELDDLINNYVNLMIKMGYIVERENVIYLSGDGFEEIFILSRCIHLNLIRYLVAVTVLKNIQDNTMDVDTFVQNCLLYARRLPTDVTDNAPEFADPIIFRIMCNTFIRHKYFTLSDDKTIIVNHPKVLKLASAAEPLLGARDVRILNGKPDQARTVTVGNTY